jgi:CDP-glucose 4,6-dehydratase
MVIDQTFWRGRRVFLTGHTGFKGAWASLLLSRLGADVYGFALAPENEADIFQVAEVGRDVHHCLGDVRDLSAISAALAQARPDVVIHMAAQSLVRLSYAEPVATYATNVMGTVNLLEAVRHTHGVRAVVVVTSDKCYENRGWVWGYRETDRLGGHDPYSNSKACAELVVDAYRRSFFSHGGCKVATARAGNVIGGGDWAQDRLVPDAMRAFMAGAAVRIRNPRAVRPWQHVLDPVAAYLVLAQSLLLDGNDFGADWNFGPTPTSDVPVGEVVEALVRYWGAQAGWEIDPGEHPHEAAYLKLDCSKAASRLRWSPAIELDEALRLTVAWYRAYQAGAEIRAITLSQIQHFLSKQQIVQN